MISGSKKLVSRFNGLNLAKLRSAWLQPARSTENSRSSESRYVEKQYNKIERIIQKRLNELKTILESTRLVQESLMVALEPAKLMQETVQRITEPLSQMQQYHTELARKLMSSAVLSSDYFKAINSLDNLSTLATRSLSNLLPSLYIASTLEESEKISKEALTHPLIKRLDKLPTGIEKWSEYEELCQEILDFCFVPPLLESERRSATRGGLHKRDLLYPIPHDVDGFWAYVKNAYSSLSLIVECKNYSDPIGPNAVVITSKYFGDKKLGTFGIILSRNGPKANCWRQQIQYWQDEGKMILCLSDEDLKDMITLKLKGKEPETVLDRQYWIYAPSLGLLGVE